VKLITHSLLEEGLPIHSRLCGCGEVPSDLFCIDRRPAYRLGQVAANDVIVAAQSLTVVLLLLLDIFGLEQVLDRRLDERLKTVQGIRRTSPRAVFDR
jgi:hypothetical protein